MRKTMSEYETILISNQMEEHISKHFKVREFACKDGTKVVMISRLLAQILEELREKIGEPIYIKSGFRTITHNKKVGGVTLSYHQFGMAADIRAETKTPKELYSILDRMMEGWGGLELHDTFVHVDTRDKAWRANKEKHYVTMQETHPRKE